MAEVNPFLQATQQIQSPEESNPFLRATQSQPEPESPVAGEGFLALPESVTGISSDDASRLAQSQGASPQDVGRLQVERQHQVGQRQQNERAFLQGTLEAGQEAVSIGSQIAGQGPQDFSKQRQGFQESVPQPFRGEAEISRTIGNLAAPVGLAGKAQKAMSFGKRTLTKIGSDIVGGAIGSGAVKALQPNAPGESDIVQGLKGAAFGAGASALTAPLLRGIGGMASRTARKARETLLAGEQVGVKPSVGQAFRKSSLQFVAGTNKKQNTQLKQAIKDVIREESPGKEGVSKAFNKVFDGLKPNTQTRLTETIKAIDDVNKELQAVNRSLPKSVKDLVDGILKTPAKDAKVIHLLQQEIDDIISTMKRSSNGLSKKMGNRLLKVRDGLVDDLYTAVINAGGKKEALQAAKMMSQKDLYMRNVESALQKSSQGGARAFDPKSFFVEFNKLKDKTPGITVPAQVRKTMQGILITAKMLGKSEKTGGGKVAKTISGGVVGGAGIYGAIHNLPLTSAALGIGFLTNRLLRQPLVTKMLIKIGSAKDPVIARKLVGHLVTTSAGLIQIEDEDIE